MILALLQKNTSFNRVDQAVTFNWPADTKDRFRNDLIRTTHRLHTSNLFNDDGLADLLDRYPREKLGIYSFPPQSGGSVEWLRGQAPDASGKVLIEAVKTGRMWLNLRNAGQYLSEYQKIEDTVFDHLEAATGEAIFKRDCGVLISSPNKHVNYHLDIPMVCLVHLRGQKTMYVYPRREPFVPPQSIEGIALREQEEALVFDDRFETDAVEVVLNPGDAVTWPQNAPHRVQNADNLCVSLSCEFLTKRALIRSNAIYANGILRRSFGMSPSLDDGIGPKEIAKAAFARAAKLIKRPPEKSPTPISFELNADTLSLNHLDNSHALHEANA